MALIFDERGFGTEEQLIPWTDLRSVGIRTTSGGPWAEDVFWMFLSREGAIEIPGEAMTRERLSVVQRQLEGIDNGKIIRAMSCAEDRMFRIWHRDGDRTGWNAARARSRFEALVQRLG